MLFQSFLVACYATLHATFLSVHLSIFSSDVANKRSFCLGASFKMTGWPLPSLPLPTHTRLTGCAINLAKFWKDHSKILVYCFFFNA